MVPVTGQPSKASSSPAGWLSETSRRKPYPGASSRRSGRALFSCAFNARGRLADVGKCPRKEFLQVANEYKQTMNLPSTSFPMRASLAAREPERLKAWNDNKVYELAR